MKGAIRANEVVVDSGWSDYVFDNGYRTEPLSEVEKYIGENHRLPGIPSAQEVAQKGVSLGEMQAKLLAKIEELTLHMIESDKRSARLERENSELRRDVDALKNPEPATGSRGLKGAASDNAERNRDRKRR